MEKAIKIWMARLRNLIARGSLAVVGVLLLVLAVLTGKDSVIEYSRLVRLGTEGRQVVATIVRVDIEKRHPSNTDGGEDRTRWEYLRLATVRYTFDDRNYSPDTRHLLTGPYKNVQVGDAYPIIVLPDLPEKPYAPDAIVGSWIAVFAQPLLLVLTAALCGFGALYRPLWTG